MTRGPQAIVRHMPEIGITVVSKWIFNCYVVHDGGDGRPFVVDLGLPSQLPVVEQVLAEHGMRAADLGAAVATHGHADHVGGLPALRDAHRTPIHLPAAIDAMRAGTVPLAMPGPRAVSQIIPVLADQPRDLRAAKELIATSKVICWDAKGVRLPFEPDSWLADDGRIPGLADWRVLHTPGHSADSTCIYHEPTRTLISGDAVLSARGRAWFNPEYVDSGRSAETEQRLRGLAVEHLLPGHGRIVTGPSVTADARSHDDRDPLATRLGALWSVVRNHAHCSR